MAMREPLKSWSRPEDWLQLIAGVYLLLVPALYAATRGDGAASWNSYILGALVALLALWTLASPRNEALEWTGAVLGLWVLVSPFVLGFTDLTAAAVSSYIVGAVVLVVSVLARQRAHRAVEGGPHRVAPS